MPISDLVAGLTQAHECVGAYLGGHIFATATRRGRISRTCATGVGPTMRVVLGLSFGAWTLYSR